MDAARPSVNIPPGGVAHPLLRFGPAGSEAHALFEARVRAVLAVARLRHAPLELDQLLALLPAGGAWTREDLCSVVASHPGWGQVVDGYVHAGPTATDPEIAVRRRRSEAMIAEGRRAVAQPLRPALALTRCIGMSGSVAYGFADPGDDIDFFVVAKPGGTWLFLLFAFLLNRKAHGAGSTAAPWCFNYVVEERAAEEDFGVPRGFLVAREALSLRLLQGADFYRGLLDRAAWMEAELPQLYALRDRDVAPREPSRSLGPLARTLNVALYPLLAAYLQAMNLLRNHRLRREAPSKVFSTETSFRRLQLRTERFEELGEICRPGSVTSPD